MLDALSAAATSEVALYVIVAAYFAVSLTIPFWVPIVKRLLGESGVFWVFSTLTYYAYLAWVLFAVLLVFALHRAPLLGLPWLLAVGWRVASFVRLGSRLPPPADHLEAGGGGGDGGGSGGGSSGELASSPLGRVLLVGNGPSIRGSGLGRAIDSFDTVVRFNSFVTKGIEEDTGSKTSIWCHMMQVWVRVRGRGRVRVRVTPFALRPSPSLTPNPRQWYHVGGVELVQTFAQRGPPHSAPKGVGGPRGSANQAGKGAAAAAGAARPGQRCCEPLPLPAWTTCYAWSHVVLAPLCAPRRPLRPPRILTACLPACPP